MEPTPNSRLKLVSFNCDDWVMGSAHCPTEVNIWPKFRENPPRGKRDSKRTQNSRLKPVTLNCDPVSLHGWAMGSAHHFTETNIWPKLKKILPGLKEMSSGHEIQGSNSRPWAVTLSLSHGFYTSSDRWTFDQSLEKILPGIKDRADTKFKAETHDLELWPWPWVGMVIDSAHRLTKISNWPKFKENPSTGIGDTERTRNSWLKPVTLNCDLDLVSAWLSYKFCTSSHWDKHMTKV